MDDMLSALRETLSWPLPDGPIADIAFEFSAREMALEQHERGAVQGIWQLRGFAKTDWRFVLIDFGDNPVRRFTVRKVLYAMTMKQPSHAGRRDWKQEDLLFICRCNVDQVLIVHFDGDQWVNAHIASIGPVPISEVRQEASGLDWDNRSSWRDVFAKEGYERNRSRHDRTRHPLEYYSQFGDGIVGIVADARSHDRLSSAEEHELLSVCKSSSKARERLIMSHMDAAVEMATRVYRRQAAGRIDIADLFCAAFEGVIRAVDGFDPEKGYRIAHYSNLWVRRNLDRCIADALWPIRVPAYKWGDVGELILHYDSMLESARNRAGGEMDDDEFRSMQGLDADDWSVVDALRAPVVSIDELDDIPVTDGPTTQIDDRAALQTELLEYFESLTPRERDVYLMRQSMTLEQIGNELGVTRERVRQIEARAKRKLRAAHEFIADDGEGEDTNG